MYTESFQMNSSEYQSFLSKFPQINHSVHYVCLQLKNQAVAIPGKNRLEVYLFHQKHPYSAHHLAHSSIKGGT